MAEEEDGDELPYVDQVPSFGQVAVVKTALIYIINIWNIPNIYDNVLKCTLFLITIIKSGCVLKEYYTFQVEKCSLNLNM